MEKNQDVRFRVEKHDKRGRRALLVGKRILGSNPLTGKWWVFVQAKRDGAASVVQVAIVPADIEGVLEIDGGSGLCAGLPILGPWMAHPRRKGLRCVIPSEHTDLLVPGRYRGKLLAWEPEAKVYCFDGLSDAGKE